MKNGKPTVLIGPYESDPTESVSLVNRCFVDGLSDRYEFIPHVANRSFGGTRRASFNVGNLFFFLKHLALWLGRVLRHRPDIVHYSINSGWALEKSLVFLQLGRWFGAKTVGHLHSGSFLDFWSTLTPRRRNRAARHLASLDALVVLSDEWKRRVIERLELSPEKIRVVNNPLDRAFEERALVMPVAREGKLILALGVMDTQKGILDIVAAAALARAHAEFTIVAAGPERQPGIRARVEQLVRENKLEGVIQLQPGVWGEEKARLFQEASAFLLPSYYENFPLVVLEAAAAGLPLIVSPVGAIPEFFAPDSSALFVEPGNVRQIADAIIRVSHSPELRLSLGRAARAAFVERLARGNIMKSLDAVYASVSQPSVHRAPACVAGVSRESPNA
jgi:glycosyltransferase involved in cell wall biosynthesis